MAIGTVDILNAARAELDTTLRETVELYHPAFDKILKKPAKVIKGNRYEWITAYQGPGYGKAIVRGGTFASGKKDISKKAYATAGAWSYSYDMSELDFGLAADMDEVGVATEGTIAAGIADALNLIMEQFLHGTGSQGTDVLPTLNGDVQYDPHQDTEYQQYGLLHFAAPASQTLSTFGQVRQGGTGGVPGHANQYGEITSVRATGAGGGLREFMSVLMEASRRGNRERLGMPDIGITDGVSFLNWFERYEDRYVPTEFRDDKALPSDPGRMSLSLGGGFKLYWEPVLDPTLTVFNGGSGYNGLMYGLNSSDIHPIAHSRFTKIVGGKPVLNGLLLQREFVASNNGFDITSVMWGWWGLMMQGLSSHFVLIGTGNA